MRRIYYYIHHYVFLTFIVLLLSVNMQAQCGNGQIVTIATQTEVNSFISNYCADFQGTLIINDNNDGIDNITDLSPLSITSIYFLTISHNNALVTLDGLSLLTYALALTIDDNPLLTNLDNNTL